MEIIFSSNSKKDKYQSFTKMKTTKPKVLKVAIMMIIRVIHATSIARNHFLSSIQGEQAVRTLLKTENILKRLLKSKPESSSRIFF